MTMRKLLSEHALFAVLVVVMRIHSIGVDAMIFQISNFNWFEDIPLILHDFLIQKRQEDVWKNLTFKPDIVDA
jgi:hypothetical protein